MSTCRPEGEALSICQGFFQTIKSTRILMKIARWLKKNQVGTFSVQTMSAKMIDCSCKIWTFKKLWKKLIFMEIRLVKRLSTKKTTLWRRMKRLSSKLKMTIKLSEISILLMKHCLMMKIQESIISDWVISTQTTNRKWEIWRGTQIIQTNLERVNSAKSKGESWTKNPQICQCWSRHSEDWNTIPINQKWRVKGRSTRCRQFRARSSLVITMAAITTKRIDWRVRSPRIQSLRFQSKIESRIWKRNIRRSTTAKYTKKTMCSWTIILPFLTTLNLRLKKRSRSTRRDSSKDRHCRPIKSSRFRILHRQ